MSWLANLVVSLPVPMQNLLAQLFWYGPPSPVTPQTQRLTFSADVLRADDLLALRLDFYNLRLHGASRQLQTDGPGDAFIVARLPGQHIAEQAFAEGNAEDPLIPPPVAARLSGESRLVFHVADDLLPLAFSVDAILAALAGATPLVGDRTGVPPGTPAIGGEAWFGGLRSQVSAIEAPWRLVLSPHPSGRWTHAPGPVGDGGKVELWHTRLGVVGRDGVPVDEGQRGTRTVRAIHSPDLAPINAPPSTADRSPFRNSLTRRDRHDLVRLTSERTLPGNAPAAVERLLLTSLGASLDVHGRWDTELDLIEWKHQATVGRDQYVKTVRKGYLFPLGHRATLVTITERKLARAPDFVFASADGANDVGQGLYAYMRQRVFIVVRQPVKQYGHRAMPFRRIEFKTLVTPNLIDPPDESIPLAVSGSSTKEIAFWPRHEHEGSRTDVLFALEGTDWEGRVSSFAAAQIFVPASADSGADIPKLVAAYNGEANGFPPVPENGTRRELPLGGQKVAYAPQQEAGDTALETQTFTTGALNASGTPHFLPAMRGAWVTIPAVREMTGSAVPNLIRLDDGFLGAPATQFGNAGEVFARIDAPPPVAFPVEKTGGLVAPDLTPQGLSRNFGPVGDVAAFAGGSFDPGAIFAGVKILGGLPLDKIFKLIGFGWPAQAGETVPGLTTVRTERDLGGGPQQVLQTRYVWNASQAQLQSQPIFEPQPGAAFALESEFVVPLTGGDPVFEVSGKLEKFQIILPPGDDALIGAAFDHVRFNAGSGRKLDVSVQFDDIVFKNELSFVNTLREYIPLDGFIDPPYLDITPTGVSAGYTLGLPSIGVGIFVLQDVSLGAGFHLPFVGGAASLRFAFCERDQPFLLTVMAFGGGGYFGLDLDTKKVTNIEAALEFGAAVAINLGVASGKASITGGVYYQKSGAGFQISAYFRAAGSLSVLGIITVSVELYVGLSYQSNKALAHGGKLFGTASVTVKIKIVFFSTSVSVSIEREFAGSDPTFIEMVTQDDWSEYCGAFALEAP